jgi:flavin reductase (DIM6/NTAB) family NADH-FMN oxidoreductase RutF
LPIDREHQGVRSAAPGAAELEREFRRCAGSFATGVAVVTACDEEIVEGMTVNSFTSVSLRPLLVSVALARGSRTLATIRRHGMFGVSVLRAGQRETALAFATRGLPFPHSLTERFVDGYVFVVDALATMRCDLEKLVPVGDHDLAIGRVLDFRYAAGEPLVFHHGRFGSLEPSFGTEPVLSEVLRA